jgi:hypothetical protein
VKEKDRLKTTSRNLENQSSIREIKKLSGGLAEWLKWQNVCLALSSNPSTIPTHRFSGVASFF